MRIFVHCKIWGNSGMVYTIFPGTSWYCEVLAKPPINKRVDECALHILANYCEDMGLGRALEIAA